MAVVCQGAVTVTLPAEVWRTIFALLVRVPDALLPDRPDPFAELVVVVPRPSSRLALLQVNKNWHSIAFELVHEHIHLTSSRCLHLLAEHLEKSKAVHGVRTLGSLTRRIDIELSNPHPDDAQRLARVLRCTPNLEIFVNRNTHESLSTRLQPAETPSCVIQALLATCPHSLRRLEWTRNECPGWSDLLDLLRDLCHLQSLALTNICGVLSEDQKPRQEHLILPSLRTLILGDSPAFSHASLANIPFNTLFLLLSQSPCQLPRLSRLEGFSPFTPDFVHMHGHKLRIVRTVTYTPLLPDILTYCSHLDTFVTIFPHQHLDVFRHPFLRRIGIFPLREDVVCAPSPITAAYVVKPLDDLMSQIDESDLPMLNEVRVRNTGSLARVVEYEWFIQKWRQRWRAKDVRFEDKDGKPLVYQEEHSKNS